MSILTKSAIIQSYLNNEIIIKPYNEFHIGPASVDITLGENYCIADDSKIIIPGKTINWKITKALKWGIIAPQLMLSDEETMSISNKIDENQSVIVVGPLQTILGHSEEFIGSAPDSNVAMMLHTKSTMARSCISICKCSSFGGPGYNNRWTLEINNSSPDKFVILIVGEPIGHIVFHRTVGMPSSYNGAYSMPDNVTEWNPKMMLPFIKNE